MMTMMIMMLFLDPRGPLTRSVPEGGWPINYDDDDDNSFDDDDHDNNDDGDDNDDDVYFTNFRMCRIIIVEAPLE